MRLVESNPLSCIAKTIASSCPLQLAASLAPYTSFEIISCTLPTSLERRIAPIYNKLSKLPPSWKSYACELDLNRVVDG